MTKKNIPFRKGSGQGGGTPEGQRPNTSHGGGRPDYRQRNYERENTPREVSARDNPPREGISRENSHRDNSYRENSYRENSYRQSGSGHNYSNHSSAQRTGSRIKTEETLDDIIADISRIEKEIELEIKEIRSLRLGM